MINKVTMGRYFCAILLLLVVQWGSSCAMLGIDENGKQVVEVKEPIEKEAVGISVSVNKPNYSSGEPILMTLRVFNHTKQEIIFSFRDTQRYDFTVEDQEGKEVWRWSSGSNFAQVLGKMVLGKERSEQLYNETYTGTLKAGEYKVTGILTAFDRAISASIMIIVR